LAETLAPLLLGIDRKFARALLRRHTKSDERLFESQMNSNVIRLKINYMLCPICW
jgi:hypothetical protein